MSTEMDFKALWNKQEAEDRPDIKKLLKKAEYLRKISRIKLIIQTVILMAIIVIMLRAGLKIEHRELTTTIGLVLMILGVVSYLITTGQLLPMLLKSSIEHSSQEYLNQLIRIKRMNEFLHKVMIDVYFGLLLAGLYLYLLQSAAHMTVIRAVSFYAILSACMVAAWLYSKRREFTKTLNPLNDTIKKLERVNAQLLNID